MTDTTTDLRGEDLIDSRDAEQRINDLEAEINWTETGEGIVVTGDPDDVEELEALRDLKSQVGDYSTWTGGTQLIRESYFETYARDLAEAVGAIESDAAWPAYCIDWAWAARDLQMDYRAVTFAGTTYYVR